MKNYCCILWYLLLANTTFAFNKQDTLRGSNGKHRAWWDVQQYQLNVHFNWEQQSISGSTTILAKILEKPIDSLQLDLQEPMQLDSVLLNGHTRLSFTREGQVYWLKVNSKTLKRDTTFSLVCFYQGRPRKAKHAPWDGGFVWRKDQNGNPWVSVACQGLGASSWWPCKDYQGDEPDKGMQISFSGIPAHLKIVSNGKEEVFEIKDNLTSTGATEMYPVTKRNWLSYVSSPINLYNVTFYIGDYFQWSDTLMGEKGKLDLSFYALREDSAKAVRQFQQVKPMLHCFEYWLGPYPFYKDGYRLVQSPYLGMEHQSAIAYGNQFLNGYLGKDRSGTGVGLLWDYIIIHESGHEWFGNNITAKDIADNWIHEGFTSYTEALYTECNSNKKNAFTYAQGLYKNISNTIPVIGKYGVNDDMGGDKYDKGQAVVHMIRLMMNDDEKFRNMLREMNQKFYHSVITSQQLEQFISDYTQLPLAKFFDQYLRSVQIPTLKTKIQNGRQWARFENAIPGFAMKVNLNRHSALFINDEWQEIPSGMAVSYVFQYFLLN